MARGVRPGVRREPRGLRLREGRLEVRLPPGRRHAGRHLPHARTRRRRHRPGHAGKPGVARQPVAAPAHTGGYRAPTAVRERGREPASVPEDPVAPYPGFSAPAPCVPGISNQRVLPAPGDDRTPKLPPCDSARRLTVASPRPSPAWLLSRCPLSWEGPDRPCPPRCRHHVRGRL